MNDIARINPANASNAIERRGNGREAELRLCAFKGRFIRFTVLVPWATWDFCVSTSCAVANPRLKSGCDRLRSASELASSALSRASAASAWSTCAS